MLLYIKIISALEIAHDDVMQNGENCAGGSGEYRVESCHKTHKDIDFNECPGHPETNCAHVNSHL